MQTLLAKPAYRGSDAAPSRPRVLTGVLKPPMLNYVRRGSGEPLVLIHPLGAELVVWEPVLERLARERDVIAVDLPGFGALRAGFATATLPTPQVLAGSVAALLDELGLGRVHVAGNSLGGWVALELAKSGRALSVAGLCTAGFWARPLGPRPGARHAPFGPRACCRSCPRCCAASAGGAWCCAARSHSPSACRRRRPRGSCAPTSPRRASSAPTRRCARPCSPGFEDIRVPVTLAWGEHDRLVAQPRERRVPGWRTVTLHGCGHIPTWDDPSQVARVLLLASA